MLKITNNDIYRNGQKVGYFTERYIMSRDGSKLGYFDSKYVYGMDGRRLAWLEGNYLDSGSGSATRVSLSDVNERIIGGLLPIMGKCAIYVLIGI